MVATNIQSLFYTMNVNFALARGEDVVGLIVFFDLVFFPPLLSQFLRIKGTYLPDLIATVQSSNTFSFYVGSSTPPSLPSLPLSLHTANSSVI